MALRWTTYILQNRELNSYQNTFCAEEASEKDLRSQAEMFIYLYYVSLPNLKQITLFFTLTTTLWGRYNHPTIFYVKV